MRGRAGILALVVAVVGAGAIAWLQPQSAPLAARELEAPSAASPEMDEELSEPQSEALPPGHPPIGPATTPPGAMTASEDETAPIRWSVPAGWQVIPNPSPMRIASYRVRATAPDTEDAEMSVARAGGTTEANIERWLGQFEKAGADTRAERVVRGLKVTIVEVTGTYLSGGMMQGAAPTPHEHWTLLAAIVETAGTPYFFKLVGPKATVHAAHAAFDRLVESVKPG